MAIDGFEGKYAFLSNFYPSGITYDGIEYPSNENFFQAMKTTNKEERKQFILCQPGVAKRLGRKLKLRPNWLDIRDTVMLHGLRKKFQRPDLRDRLLATGDEELIEGNTWGDRYWGVCDGVGKNMLGQLLMQVRKELRDGTVQRT